MAIWWHTLQYSISHLCISHTLLHPSIRVIIFVGFHPLYCKELWGKISALDVWRTSQWSWWHPNAQELRCERTVSMSQVAKLANFQEGLLHSNHRKTIQLNIGMFWGVQAWLWSSYPDCCAPGERSKGMQVAKKLKWWLQRFSAW